MSEKMKLFKKSDTTLVYIASDDFAFEILNGHSINGQIYIHVGRETGFTILYENNDVNRVIHCSIDVRESILKNAENDRD